MQKSSTDRLGRALSRDQDLLGPGGSLLGSFFSDLTPDSTGCPMLEDVEEGRKGVPWLAGLFHARLWARTLRQLRPCLALGEGPFLPFSPSNIDL